MVIVLGRLMLWSFSLKSLEKDYNFLSYGRFDRSGACVVVVNNRDEALAKEISVWELGIPRDAVLGRVMLSDENGFTTEAANVKVCNGKIYLEMKIRYILKWEWERENF